MQIEFQLSLLHCSLQSSNKELVCLLQVTHTENAGSAFIRLRWGIGNAVTQAIPWQRVRVCTATIEMAHKGAPTLQLCSMCCAVPCCFQ